MMMMLMPMLMLLTLSSHSYHEHPRELCGRIDRHTCLTGKQCPISAIALRSDVRAPRTSAGDCELGWEAPSPLRKHLNSCRHGCGGRWRRRGCGGRWRSPSGPCCCIVSHGFVHGPSVRPIRRHLRLKFAVDGDNLVSACISRNASKTVLCGQRTQDENASNALVVLPSHVGRQYFLLMARATHGRGHGTLRWGYSDLSRNGDGTGDNDIHCIRRRLMIVMPLMMQSNPPGSPHGPLGGPVMAEVSSMTRRGVENELPPTFL